MVSVIKTMEDSRVNINRGIAVFRVNPYGFGTQNGWIGDVYAA
jgi:hypothetical protein